MSTLFGKRAERFLSVLLSVTVIVWSLGLFALTASVASAATLNEGDIIRGPDGIKVYIINAKGFKRHIFNPEVFNMYGHLKWSNIKAVDQTTLDSYKTSDLYRADGDQKVYQTANDGIKRWFNMTGEQFIASGYSFNQVFVVNPKERDFYATGAEITTATTAKGLTVMLAGTDAASKVAAMGSQDVVFSTAKLTAGADAVKVNSITVERGLIGDGGIAADADFTNVKLYRNSVATENKLGSTLTLNTTTHTATFTNLNWTVNAGQTDTLIITGSLKTTGIVGNVMMLGLRSSSAISATDNPTISGTFPMFGSKVSPATTAVGSFELDVLATPADASPLSGSTDQHVARLSFDSNTEDFRLDSVKITQIGTATPSDISNLKLKYGTTVLATIPALASNNTGTFNLTAVSTTAPENIIKAGNARNFDVYVDITAGITTSRTIDISVQQASDVVSVGQTSGGVVTLLANGGGAYAADSGAAHTISQGSNSVALSAAYNPSAANYIKGTSNNKITALRFSASNSEAIRVTQLTITEQGTSGDSDISSVRLTEVGSGGEIGATLATGTISSGSVQFGTNDINAYDSDYLFEVAKGSNKDVYVVADLPTGADDTKTIIMSVAAATDVKADGVSSQTDIPAASITGTATGNTHNIDANGVVTISSSSTTAAATYVKGAQDKEFARFTFTASAGEDITVSAMNLLAVNSSNVALSTANSPTDVRVYKESVTTANLLGTVSSPASGVANFSFTDVVTAGTVRTYIVTGDIPTTNSASTISLEIDAEADVTAIGNASGVTGTAVTDGTFSVQGNDMTVATGNLGVIASSLPVYTNVTEKSNNVEVARFVLTSGSNGETVRVSSFKVTLKGTAGNSLSVDAADLSQITLYDVNGGDIAGTGVKTKVVGSLTSSAATFSGLTIDIPSGQQKVLGVKVNIGDSSRTTPNIVMGVENYYTDVSASGLESLSTVYANQLFKSGVAATLFAALPLADLDLTTQLTDADDELSEYGVPALGISAVGNGDVILIDSEQILVNAAATSTLRADVTTATDRAGFAGTTAAAHSTTGVPIILVVGGNTVLESANNTSAYADGDGAVTFTTTVAATFAAGQLMAAYDLDVDNQDDDIRLITAVSANGLTLTTVDAYSGTAVSEVAGANGVHVQLTNYGQAQLVQASGTLTLAVASGTPKASQVVAGSTAVEFSRVKLTSLYEPINITKVVFTRTGDTGVDNHMGAGADTDFASVYIQNLTNPTWGPNGNGKSNSIQISGGVATFNLSEADALIVDHNAVNGIEIALKGNLNTVTTGVTSGDAPKFYIAALNTTNLTAKGGSTGTTLSSFTAGTPTPATATNFNAQTITKGVLSVALNSGSLSGTQTRGSNQTILKLDFDSDNAGSVSTFRAGTLNEATATTTDFSPTPAGSDTDGTWAVISNGAGGAETIGADSTNYIGSAGGMLYTDGGTATAAGGGIEYASVSLDVSDYTGLGFWLRPGVAANQITVTLRSAAATSTEVIAASSLEAAHWYFIDVPFDALDTDSVDKAAVTDIEFTVTSGQTTSDTFTVDKLYFYKDKVKVNMASNAGLDGTETAAHTTSADLKDAGGTTLATGYYSGNRSATAAAETNAGFITFIPTTQFTIPTSGSTLSVVADTSALISAVSKTLSMTMSLGSADNNGAVTDGDIFWWDESFNLSDNSLRLTSGATNPLASGTISY